MSIEAMKQALDALEQHGTPLLNHEDAYSASLNALRQAIAEAEKQESDDLTIAYMSGFHDGKNKNAPQPKPKQEPVAWMREDEDCTDCIVWEQTEEHTIPLYTAPPQREWAGLTEEEIDRLNFLLVEGCQCSFGYVDNVEEFAQSIEAKLREKNT